MKFTQLIILIIVISLFNKGYGAIGNNRYLNNQNDTLPDFSMIGYAAVSGEGYERTSGGEGGDTVHIYTYDELVSWTGSREKETNPEIAVIHGKITAPSSTIVTIKHGANISVLGISNTSELENVGLNIWDYKNVIVHNLKIHEVLYPNDALTINECLHVWIDHCELYSKIGEGIGVDTYDGLLDIKEGSRYVTVSWCYIHDHMKTCLIGHTDNTNQLAIDTMMRITFHHNYFQNTDGRNPSLRFGAVHMFNNYFENITDYGIAVRQGAHAKLENNHYHSVKTPITTNKFDGPEGFVCESGIIYSGTCSAADNSITQTDCAFWNNLPYSYPVDSTISVASIVQSFSGTGKTNKPGGAFIPDTSSNNEPDYIDPLVINHFELGEISPNPVTLNARVSIYIPRKGSVYVKMINMQGNVQKEMVFENLSEGMNEIEWSTGFFVRGIYIVRIGYENRWISKKIILSL